MTHGRTIVAAPKHMFEKTRGSGPVVNAYRPDIDGLRAIAVGAVILFHLDVGIMKGGFIGVDVFFVISGYLITGLLQSEIDAGRFSILRFYDRRIRRILPALFAVILAASAAAVCLFFPPEILDFANSVVATTLFSSNIYFMMVTDYFAATSNSNPLLHTWSLAVEEQYYIVFPFLLYGLRTLRQKNVVLVISGLAIASFVVSIRLVMTDQVGAFYLAPSRAWEFFIGALLSFKALPDVQKTWLREVSAAIGLALIVAGCLKFYRNMPFPGTLALVPCIGAALLIHANAAGRTLTGRLISARPIVFIGLISYSLYLWHWPIIVFFQIWWVKPIGWVGDLGLILATCVIGTLSWYFIELPFRQKRLAASPLALRSAALASMAGFCALGIALIVSDGMAFAFPKEIVTLANYIHYHERTAYRRGTCFIDSHTSPLSDFAATTCLTRSHVKPNLLVIGDSHAAHLWSGLTDALPSVQILQATATGCKPVFGTRGHPTCVALINRALADEVATGTADAVLLSARWENEDIAQLVATVDRLARYVAQVYVSGPIVEYRENLPRLLARSVQQKDPELLITARVDAQRQVDERLAIALEGHRAVYLSVYGTLCGRQSEACRTLTDNGIPMQWDYGHLTAEGSKYLAKAWLADGRFDLRQMSP